MNKEKIVTINGRSFDAVTGLPVKSTPKAAPKPSVAKKPATAKSVHTSTQRSKTLNRKITKKPTTATTANPAQAAQKRRLSMDISRSRSISRFGSTRPKTVAARTTTPNEKTTKVVEDKPKSHPLAKKATKTIKQRRQTNQAQIQKPAATIKQEAITKALNTTPEIKKPTAKKAKGNKLSRRNVWIFSILAGILLIAVAGFISYTKIPSVSVSIAAWQAGIDASYPTYRIDGYEFQGPATHKDNEVIIKFQSPVHDSSFTLTQAKSLWDSSALELSIQENYQNNYSKTTGNGLTIFTYDNGKKASWVSEQILYTISGDSLPVGDHIRRLAISL